MTFDSTFDACSRRRFLTRSAMLGGGLCLASGQDGAAQEQPRDTPLPIELAGPDSGPPSATKPWLRKTLKDNMIKIDPLSSFDPWMQRFMNAKRAGFAGLEIETGDVNVEHAVAVARSTGMVIDGTVGGYHWAVTHTNPDAAIREKAQSLMTASLKQTAALGAKTFLIVPGHGRDGTVDEVTSRAARAIQDAIPLAEQLGVQILIENVWNQMFYDSSGDANQSADALAAFVDSFDSPFVGVQFDLGNHWKFGDVAQWVRTLGPRIRKLDIKGFSRVTGKFTPITQGDIDWPSVKKALVEIGFTGWLAAEVSGGDVDALTVVAGQMDAALDCDKTMADMRASLG